ncbi:hypothetical protein ABMA28_004989, partial [Loxostege sticticalis]
MLVLSNMFRAQNQIGPKVTEAEKPDTDTHISMRVKHRTKTLDESDVAHNTDNKSARREKCLSNSVDAIVTRDVKSKVICSAKGLLETNLDDLFCDEHSDGWDSKFGASEPTLNCNEADFKGLSKRSLASGDDSDEDSATDSDCMDEVVREQRICLGARRFGHMLRRVISRN